MNSSKFTQLPVDIAKLLLVHLNFKEIYRFLRISERYHQLLYDENLWSLYAKVNNHITSIKDHEMLNYFGCYENSSFFTCVGRCFNWPTYLAPLDRSLEVTHNHKRSYFDREDMEKIFFKKTVQIEIPHRGRPENLLHNILKHKLDRDKKIITLRPNTPVGSSLQHTLFEIYREMYDLTDQEMSKHLEHLGINLSKYEKEILGNLFDITYSRKKKIYLLDIDDPI